MAGSAVPCGYRSLHVDTEARRGQATSTFGAPLRGLSWPLSAVWSTAPPSRVARIVSRPGRTMIETLHEACAASRAVCTMEVYCVAATNDVSQSVLELAGDERFLQLVEELCPRHHSSHTVKSISNWTPPPSGSAPTTAGAGARKADREAALEACLSSGSCSVVAHVRFLSHWAGLSADGSGTPFMTVDPNVVSQCLAPGPATALGRVGFDSPPEKVSLLLDFLNACQLYRTTASDVILAEQRTSARKASPALGITTAAAASSSTRTDGRIVASEPTGPRTEVDRARELAATADRMTSRAIDYARASAARARDSCGPTNSVVPRSTDAPMPSGSACGTTAAATATPASENRSRIPDAVVSSRAQSPSPAMASLAYYYQLGRGDTSHIPSA